MKRRALVVSHLLGGLLALLVLFAPKRRAGLDPPWAMLTAMALCELLFLRTCYKKKREGTLTAGTADILSLLWALLLFWELAVSVLNAAHPVLLPPPENVFHTFFLHGDTMLYNVFYSMALLLTGLGIALPLAVLLGLYAGWHRRLREVATPIANLMAPIPAIVISPYLVSIMPSFRSASVLVIVLGVFWPNFLSTMERVGSVEAQILDAASLLHLSGGAMIWQILLPSVLPGVVGALKVTMTTSLLMLNFAELMGATHGMGYYVQNSIAYANYTHALAGILVIGMVVTALNRLLSLLQRKWIRWR